MRVRNVIVLLWIVTGCTEVSVVEKPAGPPIIEFVDIQPRTVREFQDSVLITFNYSDPDGDLGVENPDIKPLSIHDSRLLKADYQHVSLLAPKGENLDISGQLTVKLKNTFLLGTSNQEITNYELILMDRAGNASNPIRTDDITIVRD